MYFRRIWGEAGRAAFVSHSFFSNNEYPRPNSSFNPSPLIHSDSQSLIPDHLLSDYLFSLESWYTAPRAPLGATVSGNCFDHYRSMPDGNQLGLFCCQTRRFRKEAPAASRQWDASRGNAPRGRGTESSKRCPSSRADLKSLTSLSLTCSTWLTCQTIRHMEF